MRSFRPLEGEMSGDLRGFGGICDVSGAIPAWRAEVGRLWGVCGEYSPWGPHTGGGKGRSTAGERDFSDFPWILTELRCFHAVVGTCGPLRGVGAPFGPYITICAKRGPHPWRGLAAPVLCARARALPPSSIILGGPGPRGGKPHCLILMPTPVQKLTPKKGFSMLKR